MIQPNVGRARVLFGFWREKKTIDQATEITGIKRSTVGYYYRKFNTGYRPSPPSAQPASSPYQDMAAAFSAHILELAGELMNQKKYVEVVNLAKAYQAIQFLSLDAWTNFQEVSTDVDTAIILTGYRKMLEGVGLGAEDINRMFRASDRRQAKEKRGPAPSLNLSPGGLMRDAQVNYLTQMRRRKNRRQYLDPS